MAAREALVVMKRRCCPQCVHARFRGFAIVETSDGKLSRDRLGGRHGKTRRERVRLAFVNVPPILVGFAAMKCGCFQLNRPLNESESNDVVREMSRVLIMMTDHSERILRCGSTMRKGRRTQRRLAD